MTTSRIVLLLLLLGTLFVGAVIYPEGHFDHVTKIESQAQLDVLIDSTLEAGQTLVVRWIASPN